MFVWARGWGPLANQCAQLAGSRAQLRYRYGGAHSRGIQGIDERDNACSPVATTGQNGHSRPLTSGNARYHFILSGFVGFTRMARNIDWPRLVEPHEDDCPFACAQYGGFVSESDSNTVERPLGIVTDHAGPRPPSGRTDDLFRSAFEHSGVCIASLDSRHQVTDANEALCTLLRRAAQQVRGREFADLLHPDVRAGVRRHFTDILDGTRGRFTDHVAMCCSDGTVVTGKLTAVAVRRGAGQDTRAVLVLFIPNTAGNGATVVDERKVLTGTQARILEGVAAGKSTVKMASQLYLSRQGVEYHLSALLRRLKAANRPALVSKAYTLGILGVASWPPRVLPDYVR